MFGQGQEARELACVPIDVVGVVTHEVAHVEGVPQGLVRFKGLGVQGHQAQRFALAGLYHGVRVGCVAAQGVQRGAVQVFQQLAFPGVPDLWAGASDVGHGQQVQSREVVLVAHALSKGVDDIGVADVLLLRDVAHGQVLADQKFDQFSIGGVHAVFSAELAHLLSAQLRMVTTTAFGDVVEERGRVQHPRLVPARGEL